MRYITLLALALLGTPLATSAFAVDYADPKALVEAFYAGYQPPNEFPPDQAPLLSERLNRLYEADAREADGDIGRIDFDPFVNAQDYQLGKLEIGDPYLAGGKAVVRVSFENMGTPNELGVLLVKEGGGWKIDDVWNADTEYGYDLLDILQAPMP